MPPIPAYDETLSSCYIDFEDDEDCCAESPMHFNPSFDILGRCTAYSSQHWSGSVNLTDLMKQEFDNQKETDR